MQSEVRSHVFDYEARQCRHPVKIALRRPGFGWQTAPNGVRRAAWDEETTKWRPCQFSRFSPWTVVGVGGGGGGGGGWIFFDTTLHVTQAIIGYSKKRSDKPVPIETDANWMSVGSNIVLIAIGADREKDKIRTTSAESLLEWFESDPVVILSATDSFRWKFYGF